MIEPEPRVLLAFEPAVAGPIPPVGPRPRPLVNGPAATRQAERLTPQFSALQAAFSARRMQAMESTSEPDPELVVVLELAGTVEGFMRAVAGVEGLEFLAEHDQDEVEPDDDFHYTQDGRATDSAVPETLYMVMTSSQAVAELVSLFGLWRTDPKVKFRRGLAPLKTAFTLLRAVRRWDPSDRIRETGLLEEWADTLAAGGQNSARVEIELWFRDSAARRAVVQADVERLIVAAGGIVLSSAVLPAIDYHAVLADLPYDQVQAVIERGPEAIALLTTESIMFVAPARPMTFPALEPAIGTLPALGPAPPRESAPRVALLDGLPMANHAALAGRLLLDDPDERTLKYSSSAQQHGTAMASLILHGDIAAPGPSLSTQLYVRPIMQPHEFFQDREVVAPDELLVDVVHRAFLRMFDGEGNQPPTAPSVRIVNLSIGDPHRVFTRRLSPLAKLLDWLAHRYNLLVLVSAGNPSWVPSVPADTLYDPLALRQGLLASGFADTRLRRLFSPAEAVNVLTVGAVHSDSATDVIADTVVDAVETGMPASYGAVGFGHRRSVKPEILLPGGRQLYQRPPPGVSGAVKLTPAPQAGIGPGHLVAAPDQHSGNSGTAHSYGTSNATALASRAASQIFDVLNELTGQAAQAGEGSGFPFPDAQYHPVLVKTLLVHAAHWGDLASKLRSALELEPSAARRDLTQMLGYGSVEQARLATAARTRVVLLGAGSIQDGERQQFRLPLPGALAATTEWRRLTITLGWLSPINSRSQVHRMARLWFEPQRQWLGLERAQAHHSAVRKGTVQHEILEGATASAFAPGDALTINVDCRIDAGRAESPIRYGLAASLEVGTSVRADVHAQVRQLLRVRLRERQQQITARP